MTRTFILIFTFLGSCSSQEDPLPQIDKKFEFPTIIQTEKENTVSALGADAVTEYYPPLIGKFKFGDTINISNPTQKELSEKDYLWEVKNSTESDSLSSDGLQILTDYKTSIVYSGYDYPKGLYYPVYIVNETSEPRIFFGKDEHGFAIQEALDTSDFSSWHPIESQGFTFCGNGRFRKKLNPKEYLLFLIPKYKGTEETSLRIRFQIGESVFISKSYQGTINPKQFDIKKDSWIFSRLKETKGYASSFIFYGGWPKGTWD